MISSHRARCRVGHSAHTYASSQLNRVSRRVVRYKDGLRVHTVTRPAPRRTARALHVVVTPLHLALNPGTEEKPHSPGEGKILTNNHCSWIRSYQVQTYLKFHRLC